VAHVNGSVTNKPLDDRAPLTGSVEQVAGDLSELNQLGVDHVFWMNYDDAGEQLDAMEQLLKQG
jgi:hypothetical protein